MSLKAEIETWASALEAHDAQEYDAALDLFNVIADNSKILTNIGLIYAALNEHEAAVEKFYAATELDEYLAVAFFQAGVSNFLLGRYQAAYEDFHAAFERLRSNQDINYEQLGLKFQLHAAEVLYNKGLTLIRLGDYNGGIELLRQASAAKTTPDHAVIDEAIRDDGVDYTVFSVPPGILYRPNEKKVKNAGTKDWMGKAKLITASNSLENFTSFTGAARLAMQEEREERLKQSPLSRSRSAQATLETTPQNDSPALKRSLTVATRNLLLSSDSHPSKGLGPPQRSLTVRSNNSAPEPRGDTGRRSPEEPRGPSPPAQTRPLRLGSGGERDLPRTPPEIDASKLESVYGAYLETQTVPSMYFDGDTGRKEDNAPPVPTLPKLKTDWRMDEPSKWSETEPSVVKRSPSRDVKPRGEPTRQGTLGRRPSQMSGVPRRPYGGSSISGFDRSGFPDSASTASEMRRLRVKIHYEDDIRGMSVSPQISFDDFVDMINRKFGFPPNGLRLKFKDLDDGSKVSLIDESDFEMAIEAAMDYASRPMSTNKESSLVIYCETERGSPVSSSSGRSGRSFR